MAEKTLIRTITVDTLNEIQNNQYMGLLDKKTMISRDQWKDFGVDIYMFIVELQRRGFEIVLVLGYEGTGKSYGIMYLEPGSNMWFNADMKNPTFKEVSYGDKTWPAREVYGTKRTPTKYMFLPETYRQIIEYIDMLESKEMLAPPEERLAFITGHVEDYKTSNGEVRQRMKVLGKMASKMNIEGKMENVLYTEVVREGDKVEYMLDTQNSGSNNARTMQGAFDERHVPNNFNLIYEALMS